MPKNTSRIRRPVMFLNAIFKVCKISKTKRRNTLLNWFSCKLLFDATLLMTDIIRRSSITDRVTWQRCHTKSQTEKRFGGQHAQNFSQYWSNLRTSGVIFRFQNRNLYNSLAFFYIFIYMYYPEAIWMNCDTSVI